MQPRGALLGLLLHPDGLSKEALADFTTPSPTAHHQVAREQDWRSSLLVATIKFLFTWPGPILLERGSLDSVPLSPRVGDGVGEGHVNLAPNRYN